MKEHQIEATKLQVEKLQAKKQFIEEEAEFFIKAYQSLAKKEDLKPFDDLESQQEYWNAKLSLQMEMCEILGMPPKPELIETILALDDSLPVKHKMNNTLASFIEKKQLERNNE
jgi:hypothetical protein